MDERSAPADLSLLRLRIFAAVVEQGGYSAAGRALGVSQPTVSFHVQALERTFGARLLDYRGRRVHVTAAGEALYALARRTLRDVDELTARIAGLHAGRAGRVRLGASMAFEQAFFFDMVVAPFTRDHPDVELSLHFGTSRHMVEAVRARELDLGYVMHWHTPADVRYRPLHTSRVVFFVAEDHPLAAQPQPSIEAVGAAGLITAPLNSFEWAYYGHALRGVGLHHHRVALEVSGIQARILAAQAGLGVLVVFWPPYAPRVTLPGLRPLPATGKLAAGIEFGLVENANEPLAPPVASFAGWLRRVTLSDGSGSTDEFPPPGGSQQVTRTRGEPQWRKAP
ncbi:MAG: LysR family transcriptional regulator [Streptosporangiales bacterium]|nr:LysR family transcriptional regulator [Streptosporangiales bacterium]